MRNFQKQRFLEQVPAPKFLISMEKIWEKKAEIWQVVDLKYGKSIIYLSISI